MHTGGAVYLASGEDTATSSGTITIRSINSGTSGVSGMIICISCTAVLGNGGAIEIGTAQPRRAGVGGCW